MPRSSLFGIISALVQFILEILENDKIGELRDFKMILWTYGILAQEKN